MIIKDWPWDNSLKSVPEELESKVSQLIPGEHSLIGCSEKDSGRVGMTLRLAGLEIRDSLSIQGPGWRKVVFLCRAPVEDSITDTVLKYGQGALNIDECRVSPTGENLDRSNTLQSFQHPGWQRPWQKDPEQIRQNAERRKKAGKKSTTMGRWPANLILVHSEECEAIGTKKVKGSGPQGKGHTIRHTNSTNFLKGMESTSRKYVDSDGKEEVTDWRCVPECPVRLLDEQSGVLTSGAMKRTVGDSWGASRFFYQTTDVWSYLEKLIQMPDEEA